MNRRKIAIAALGLVGREGIEALTMKRLAEEVDRKPASLYNHIAGKQDLIEAMRGILSERIDDSYFDSLGWRDALLAWARDYIKAFAEHPKVIAVMATTAISDPATLATYEKVVASSGPRRLEAWRSGGGHARGGSLCARVGPGYRGTRYAAQPRLAAG